MQKGIFLMINRYSKVDLIVCKNLLDRRNGSVLLMLCRFLRLWIMVWSSKVVLIHIYTTPRINKKVILNLMIYLRTAHQRIRMNLKIQAPFYLVAISILMIEKTILNLTIQIRWNLPLLQKSRTEIKAKKSHTSAF